MSRVEEEREGAVLTGTFSIQTAPRVLTTLTMGLCHSIISVLETGELNLDQIFSISGLAWVAIFVVISLEGWTDVMYLIQDVHSFYNFVYFVVLIIVKFHHPGRV